MDKQTLISKAGSQAKLAALLNISQAAISQWKVVPKLRLLEVKTLRPDWFEVQSEQVSDTVAKTV
jgi:predicted transcriptional regulator